VMYLFNKVFEQIQIIHLHRTDRFTIARKKAAPSRNYSLAFINTQEREGSQQTSEKSSGSTKTLQNTRGSEGGD
jgi:hypothetical protein